MASSPLPSSSPPPPGKKLKMSSASASDEEEEAEHHQNGGAAAAAPCLSLSSATAGGAKRRLKRRKVAIFLGYCGAGYQGMQKNPGARTIEGDLEEALFLSGGVPEPDRGIPRRYDWARAARTDKGVSAAGQVVSGRFYVDPPGFVDRLNSNLAPQIRIFGFKRVTASFNAKKFCDRRRYIYLLPVFALDPNAHPDRESVVASMGSEKELAKCLECSERGRKVPGLMGRPPEKPSNRLQEDPAADSESKSSATTVGRAEHGDGAEDSAESIDPSMNGPNPTISTGEEGAKPATEERKLVDEPEAEIRVSGEEGEAAAEGAPQMAGRTSEFRYGEEERKRFNAILKRYEGTHNFHNFTTRTKAEDPSARRYIVSFDAGEVVTIAGIDFVRCEVVGQSFMLHQIRKMIGLAVAVMRNCTPESMMETALRK